MVDTRHWQVYPHHIRVRQQRPLCGQDGRGSGKTTSNLQCRIDHGSTASTRTRPPRKAPPPTDSIIMRLSLLDCSRERVPSVFDAVSYIIYNNV